MSFSDYPNAPDKESSTLEYQERFSGEVGRWLVEVQAQITTQILDELVEKQSSPLRVLDVGGGHGQNVQVVLDGGHSLTVLGSDTACGSLLENVTSSNFKFTTGDMRALPFNDGEFDLVLSYRMMAHIDDWRKFAKELQRVSKSWVAVDYPTIRSANALSAALYVVKKGIEKNTRKYRLFAESEISAGMHDAGLKMRQRRPQFLFPMALHRAMNRKAFSVGLEKIADTVRLTRLFGSPVIAVYEKING
jgi:ubiquinone/menaquinone biosynthesis C-methylase UbiE